MCARKQKHIDEQHKNKNCKLFIFFGFKFSDDLVRPYRIYIYYQNIKTTFELVENVIQLADNVNLKFMTEVEFWQETMYLSLNQPTLVPRTGT